jgi:hypothetical protein
MNEMELNIAHRKDLRAASLIEEITSNSLQIEQLSEDVRGLMYAVRDLTEQLALKKEVS